MNHFVIKGARLLSGLLMGVLIYLIVKPSDGIQHLLAVLVSLVTALLVSHIIDDYLINKKLDAQNRFLSQVLTYIVSESEFYLIKYILLKHNQAVIPLERFPSIWLDMLWNIKKTYHTTVLSTKEQLSSAHNTSGLDIQSCKIKVFNCEIKRIFILKDQNHYNSLYDIMEMHYNHGVNVKYIILDDINMNFVLKKFKSKIETYDFSIIDSKILLLNVLDKKNNLTKLVIKTQENIIHTYEEFYKLLFNQSNEFKISTQKY